MKITKSPRPALGGFSIEPALSGNGRLVAFESSVRLLPEDSNNLRDVYLRDRAAGVTTLVSATSGSTPGIGSSRPEITPDGRFVAYDSDAGNLVPGDTNGNSDVFVKDLSTGTTRRVSVAEGGGDPNGFAALAGISADGRFVAFVSNATNLVPNDANGGVADVFVRDLSVGTTEQVSVSSAGVQGNLSAVGESVAISGDGRFVAFSSFANNLVRDDTNGVSDVFVRDRSTGTTTRVSVRSDGSQIPKPSRGAAISGNGQYVAFVSAKRFPTSVVLVHNRANDATHRVSVPFDGSPVGGNFAPSISRSGRYVSFTSTASNLVPGDTNGVADVFVRDRVTQTTRRVSVSTVGDQANGSSGSSSESSMSANGRHVAFDSLATNLVAHDDSLTDIFVRDRFADAPPSG